VVAVEGVADGFAPVVRAERVDIFLLEIWMAGRRVGVR
jgi:hypothetical protein